MHYLKPLIIFLFIWAHQGINAQPLKRYKTFSYSVNEGLLQSTIADLEIDKNNFCWISFPNGIQKFDGSNFEIIPIQPGLPDDKNVFFFKTKRGTFLISHSKGISKYEIDRNKFQLIYNCPPGNNLPPVFIGEDNGIIYVNEARHTMMEFDSRSYKKIAQTEITSIINNSKANNETKFSGNIIDHKVVFMDNSILYLWDLQKRKIVNQSSQIPIIASFFLKMKSGNEVFYYRNGSNYLHVYNFLTGASIQKFAPGLIYNYIPRSNFFTWHGKKLISLGKNLYETDNKFLELKTQLVNFQNQSNANSAINVVKEDNFGNLWLSTVADGIKKIINSNYHIKYYGIANGDLNNTLSVLPDKKMNRVFIGTSKGGLFVYDTTQQLVANITSLSKDLPLIGVNQVIKNKNNEYYVFILDAKYVAKLAPDLSFIAKIPIISSVPEERRGVSYFANLLYQNEKEAVIQTQGSIFRLNFSKNTVQQYEFTTSYTHSGILYENQILTHSNDELLFLDTSNFQIVKRIPFKHTGGVRSFAIAEDGNIYLGTNKGIFKIKVSGEILEQYNRSTGLPDECIYTIIAGKKNILWCSTNKGIIKISADRSFLQITREDGLQENEFNTNVSAIANDGEFFYGGVNGGNSFFPLSINPEEQKLNIIFTNILVNNEEKFADTAAWKVTEIDLPYYQNLLSFDFIAMGNNNPGQYIYQYKMEGIDEKWLLNKEMQTVRYFLPPGKYVFQVFASRYFNNDARPLKQIEITIHPPFWKTWWFLSLLSLFSLALLTYIIEAFIRHAYQEKVRLLEAENRIQLERERISRDLHDNIGGYANALLYKTELLGNEQDKFSQDNIIGDLRFASKEIITSLRETIWALKKTNYSAQDCLIRIRNFVQPFTNYYPLINFKIEGDASEEKNLSHSIALHIVRIVQEAVSNAIKHAGPKNIIVTSNVENENWTLTVHDDGQGFDVNTQTDLETGNGLANIRKRVVEANLGFQIYSSPVEGTTIKLIIPLY